jgi:hypothetical protein
VSYSRIATIWSRLIVAWLTNGISVADLDANTHSSEALK